MEEDVEEKKNRLVEAFGYLKSIGKVRTQNEVADSMGANRVNVSYAFNGKERYLTNNFLKRFNISFGGMFNIEWLMKGEGTMLLGQSAPPVCTEAEPLTFHPQSDELYLETKAGTKYYKIGENLYKMRVPLVPYGAYARYINTADSSISQDGDEWGEIDFIVDRIGLGRYMAFEIKGDSMDDDSKFGFSHGDKVLVRELDRIHWTSGLHYRKFKFWVIVLSSSILCKEITDQDLETGDITCHSLNPSPEYRDFKVNLNEDVYRLFNVIQKLPAPVNYE